MQPKFELVLSVIDLTNIPLVVGSVAVKWYLPSSSSAEHRGRTDKAKITTEHRATWDYVKTTQVKLTIDKTLALQPCDIFFEILQEYHDGGKGGRVHLGNVKINLAEYTNVSDSALDDHFAEDGMITRRYLMQDSKVNATLKIGISMKQTDGDTNYIAPPIKSAMTVGGIAGIISTEAGGETDEMPSIASKSRELAEAQDIYRRTLAASWACERGELAPDKLVEDLFAGGDGGKFTQPPIIRSMILPSNIDDSSNSSDADSRHGRVHSKLSPDSARYSHQRGGSGKSTSSSQASNVTAVSGRGSIEQQMKHSHSAHNSAHLPSHHHRRKGHSDMREVTEFELRDDLCSWQIRT